MRVPPLFDFLIQSCHPQDVSIQGCIELTIHAAPAAKPWQGRGGSKKAKKWQLARPRFDPIRVAGAAEFSPAWSR
jgi:hypothetical protein